MRVAAAVAAIVFAVTGCGGTTINLSGNAQNYDANNLPSQHIAKGQYRVAINGNQCFGTAVKPHLFQPNGITIDLVDQNVISIQTEGDYKLAYTPAIDSSGNLDTSPCAWQIALSPT
jgi:hypothetical protein